MPTARFIACLLALSTLAGTAGRVIAQPRAAPATQPYLQAASADLQWWREARFGMFIHWGPVSLKGTEIGWSRGGERRGHGTGRGPIPVEEYDNLYRQFNPTKFNAREWVAIARDAGMRYLVFTSKHHDGFCEFDSKLTDYKVTNSPFKRDIVGELAAACHEAKLPVGFYYSQPDWHHPDYRNGERHARYIEYLHGQLRELCSNYGKLDLIWFDGLGGKAADWNAPELFKLIRSLQPNVLINNRCGLPADFDTPEQEIGHFQTHRPWESCITICRQWAWKPDDQLKTLKECLHTLIRCAGGDGNLLFNVGPMPTGEIEPRQVERLKEMGAWLRQYGQTIYGTRGGPWRPGTWGAATCQGDTVYVHVLNWPGDAVVLPAIERRVVSSSLLTGGTATVKQTDQGVEIAVPGEQRKELDTIVVLKLDGPAFGAKVASPAAGALTAGCKTRASNVFHNDARHGADMACDGDPETRWATDAGTQAAWLEVDLGKPVRIGRTWISEAYAGRVRAFELQCRDGEAWRTFAKGTTIGESLELTFEPVTAQAVRLSILKATEGPTIWEFALFAPK